MAEEKRETGGARPVELIGESKELVAFALLRYLAQLEQGLGNVEFDRDWLLDAYAECLDAVEGKRDSGRQSSTQSITRQKSRQ